ncbi:endolytic transglycosylase MltG [Pseudonocardia sp. WMMC193]|uniref:endolytic transglycosylase MltG n=1 Tax=Pseudonocardia sp. WMMC193 TaxID=2911965 RepID=UPI001F22C153|nr:endolytic transglycosylase MltG [Pseudonocardia sp. WMMC193]MCF7549194.1 endolytic transglycosylase MltG [Pseudonocardia sp. WMMC193]
MSHPPPGPFLTRREELAARRAELRENARRRRRRGVLVLLAALLLLGVVFGGGAYLVGSRFFTDDFDGPGEGDAVVRVIDGDTTGQIATMLANRGVVASREAFTEAAAEDSRILAIQPGYYQVKLKMSGAAAVAALVDPGSRVGRLEVRGGTQLDDTRSPDGTVAPGVLSLIAAASCAELDGTRTCLTADDLRQTMATADPASLGVPEWAVEDVARAEPGRRFEGLITPGLYDVAPGTSAADVWKSLLAVSVAKLESDGLTGDATHDGLTAYQLLVLSSIVEKEGITPDMPKVARVITNRLDVNQRLEMDSTVNYPLDLQALRTTAEARATAGPYNTYQNTGLPPTPIAAAGKNAIAAGLAPEPGPWTFFVRCQTDGTSCFATSLAEHQANVGRAIANGAF